MNRISREHRRGRSLTARDADENLDLFSRNRRTLSLASSDDSDGGLMKLGRVSVGSVKLSRTGMEDLFSSVDGGGGKNDYDWLLTPPGTPLLSDSNESQPNLAPSRNSSSLRSVANSKSSRLSVTQMENSYPSRPTRSSSVTRSSVPSTNYNTYSNSNRSSSILNTSSASVTSISRPSTPNSRSTLTAGPRSSTPTPRVSSRPSTPVKSRPTPGSTFGEKTRAPPNHTRPSTPTSRPQTPTNVSSPALRSNSRPSTPTRRNPTQNPQVITSSNGPSTGRIVANGRNSAPSSRGSSPGPRVRPPSQPIVPPNFSLDTPPNLRTTMPNRPVSAGRSRPSAPASRVNPEPVLISTPRRQSSSPIVTRGRLPDPGKGRLHSNGHNTYATESQKTPPTADQSARRLAKSMTSTESTGFGRTISKKSLDMALRHMDIRQGSGSIRSSPGSTLFPQSIRPGTGKSHSARVSDIPAPISSNGSNGVVLENGHCHNRFQDNELFKIDADHFSARVSESDMYESSRYDAILLKEDSKNTNWLFSEDKSDQGFMFDHRFESLPEPFDPL